tara:strand:+ start:495 stop:917 length:423 start_codon:yes stop_codon:yes gene_type:complete
MGEEFHAIIKLVSGEEIMSLLSVDDEGDETLLILQNPIIMKFQNHGHHSFIKVKPWMELTDEDIFIVNLNKVITMTETNDKRLIDVYNNFIEDIQEPDEKLYKSDGEVNLDSTMGYVTSVPDARKKLEQLFNIKPESKES